MVWIIKVENPKKILSSAKTLIDEQEKKWKHLLQSYEYMELHLYFLFILVASELEIYTIFNSHSTEYSVFTNTFVHLICTQWCHAFAISVISRMCGGWLHRASIKSKSTYADTYCVRNNAGFQISSVAVTAAAFIRNMAYKWKWSFVQKWIAFISIDPICSFCFFFFSFYFSTLTLYAWRWCIVIGSKEEYL